jgi:hypothetical protein
MVIMDAVYETFGVEYIRSRNDTFHEVRGIEYLNTGYPYTNTVLYDHNSRMFSIGKWGDIVERNERRFGED